jgi:hypothetical protein
LYEAARVILTRSSAESTLRDWGLKLRERVGFKRAAVAVARKLSVVMHAMLKLRLRRTVRHHRPRIIVATLPAGSRRTNPSLPGHGLNHPA